MTREELIEVFTNVYFRALKDKEASGDTVEFAMHWQSNIAKLVDDILLGTYTPRAKSFMRTTPCPREIIASEFSLRLCDTYLVEKLTPLIDNRLTDRTFSNRVGYGNDAAINQVISDIYDVSEGYTNDNCWIFKIDVKGFFPNANQDIAYKLMSEILEEDYQGEDKDVLRYLLLRGIYSYPADHCDKVGDLRLREDYPAYKSIFVKPDGVGGSIGRWLWQVTMNVYLNEFDKYIVEECGLHYTRFVDDAVIVTNNKESMLALMPELRQKLADVGCEMHPNKFYCQHYTKGVEFLGTKIKQQVLFTSARILRNFKAKIMAFNKMPSERYLKSFMSSMNSYLGIMKARNMHNEIMRILQLVNNKWWRYCHYDSRRVCIKANEGYSEKEILCRQYKLNIKGMNYGSKKEARCSRV